MKEGERLVTHRGLCFFLQSHIRTVFCIVTQAPVRYRILFFTAGDRKEGKEGRTQVNMTEIRTDGDANNFSSRLQ